MESQQVVNSVAQQQPRLKIYLRFWFWWVVLTITYIASYPLGASVSTDIPGKFAATIGLFVPIGPNNIMVIGVIAIPFLLVEIFLFEAYLSKISLHPVSRGAIYLIILFVSTLVVDFLFFHQWCSLNILLKGTMCGNL